MARKSRVDRTTVEAAPNISVATARAANGELCRVIQITDATGVFTTAIQLNAEVAKILGDELRKPISPVIIPDGILPADHPGANGAAL